MYDTIIIGGGIVGSSTAYHLAKMDKKTVLLEQHILPHTRGSSHGETRTIRKAYEEKHNAKMASDSHKMWLKLEREIGTRLYHPTGIIQMDQKPGDFVLNATESLKAIDAEYTTLSGFDLNQLYDNVQFDEDVMAVYENDAGVLKAEKCLNAYQNLYKKKGGCIKDGEKVINIQPGRDIIVTTTHNTYKCRSLVITAGPWTNKVLNLLNLTLPLKLQKINVCFWSEKNEQVKRKGITPFYFHSERVYGIPPIGDPYMMKICLHDGPELNTTDLASAVVPTNEEENHYMDRLKTFVDKFFPTLEKHPAKIEHCIYTVTPDEDFIIDTHPCHENIVIGAGFSGHGFKMAPVVGDVLSRMASRKHPGRDLTPYRIDRFKYNFRFQSKI